MPGIVVFRRRWSVGSDDLVVPAIFFLILHGAWLVVLSVIRGVVHFDTSVACTRDLALHLLGYIGVLGVSFLLEFAIALVSLRGSILDLQPRAAMQYLLYVRLVVLLVEVAWLVVGVVWAFQHYQDCQPVVAKKAFLVVIICNWLLVMSVIISLWCTFDSAGRKWVKMKKFQDSLKEKKRVYRRTSGSHRRNWRQRSKIIREFFRRKFRRKAIRAYEESWDRRLKLLCCCVERKGRNQNSMSEIAQLFTEFFRDLDVVPSDVVAGLVLLRKFQKGRMGMVVQQPSNDVYQYLSGVAITPQTQFLQLSQPEVLSAYRLVLHYMYYALAAYGWPLYVMMNTGSWFCRLIPSLSCCCCCGKTPRNTEVIEDNCCLCNYAALKRISQLSDSELVYATYHVDIGETPFYVALDHKHRKVVVCVRGTLSLQDVLTDLQAEPESLPLQPPREEWLAHKGMVQAAVYIKKKLEDDGILERAFERDPDKQTQTYDLILVGHSLGAGTAAILAILLQPDYPTLHCYAYSPPGGLLSMACCEETKEFITSVVVGKDVVPRIGLPQMEILRTDLINVIKGSTDPKWKIIAQGLCCCGAVNVPSKAESQRDVTAHPSDSGIGLSAHTPLYPPGKIIHIVRSHPKENKSLCKRSKPVYQAVWANNADFDEVLISPTMINDHMPDYVLEALEKASLHSDLGPPLPQGGPQPPPGAPAPSGAGQGGAPQAVPHAHGGGAEGAAEPGLGVVPGPPLPSPPLPSPGPAAGGGAAPSQAAQGGAQPADQFC